MQSLLAMGSRLRSTISLPSSGLKLLFPAATTFRCASRVTTTTLDLTLGMDAAQISVDYDKMDIFWPRAVASLGFSRHSDDTTRVRKATGSEKNKDEYDLVINNDQLVHLNEKDGDGWPIELKNNELWTNRAGWTFEKQSKAKTVAVSGVFNTGKTFFLCNLDNLDLPDQSDGKHTKGLSIKVLEKEDEEETPIILMDTAGNNSPIEMANESSLSDKKLSEQILQNTLFDVADYHVCVLNKLQWRDQEHFEMLYNRLKHAAGGKLEKLCMFVVHNFRDHSLEDLSDHLLDDVAQAYKHGKFRHNRSRDGIKGSARQKLNRFINYLQQKDAAWFSKTKEVAELLQDQANFWFDSKGDNTMHHVFLVRNDTQAGKAFNRHTFNYVAQALRQQPDGTEFSVAKVFEALENNTNMYVQFCDEKGKTVNKSFGRQDTPRNLIVAKDGDQPLRMMLSEELRKKNVQVDLRKPRELGYHEVFVAAHSWAPRTDTRYMKKKAFVMFELPGKLSKTATVKLMDDEEKSGKKELLIQGEKVREKLYDEGDDELVDIREGRYFGPFRVRVPLRPGYTRLVTPVARENGVLTVEIENSDKDNGEEPIL